MKILFTLLTILSFSAQAEKLYSFENYPELLQEAISNDMHKANPNFITEVEVPSNEISPTFIAQLKFDKVTYSLKQNGVLTKIKVNYKDVLMTQQVYRNTYLHMLGMRMIHFSRSNDCEFYKDILKSKESNGFKEQTQLLNSDKLYWLNYAQSNLQKSRDVEHGLRELSKWCGTKEKKMSKTEAFLYKYDFINYTKLVEVPEEPKMISLEELLKHNFFHK